jgi:exodeoxyribonuclease V alpha subunit
MEDMQNKLLQVVSERIPKRFGFNPLDDIQVLVPMNRGGLGARSLNLLLQSKLNPEMRFAIQRFGWRWAVGDKVRQTINNYEKDVFNGDIGYIENINSEESTLTICFNEHLVNYEFNELDEIALAYAISIHKSQGSEYPVVVIPLAMQHYMLLERNLLYTAVTRGRKLVVLIVEKKALNLAVHNHKSQKRLGNLIERLQN